MTPKRPTRDKQSDREERERSPKPVYCRSTYEFPFAFNYAQQSSNEISPRRQSPRLRGTNIMNTYRDTVSDGKGCTDFSLRRHSARLHKDTNYVRASENHFLEFEKKKVSKSDALMDIVQRGDSVGPNAQIDSLDKPIEEEIDLDESLMNLKLRVAREVNSKRKNTKSTRSNISDDSATTCKDNHLCSGNLASEAYFNFKSETAECVSSTLSTAFGNKVGGTSQQGSLKIELPDFPDNKTSELISASSDTGSIIVDQLRNSVSVICNEEIQSVTMPCTLNMADEVDICESAYYGLSNYSACQNELLDCLVHEGCRHRHPNNNEQHTITLSGLNPEEQKDGYLTSIPLLINIQQEAYESEQVPNSVNSNAVANEAVDVQDPAQISPEAFSGFSSYQEVDRLAVAEGGFANEVENSATNFVLLSFANEEEHESAGNEVKLDRANKTEYPPEKLLSNRKTISPTSQEKLCQAMDGVDLYDAIQTSDNRKRLLFESRSRDVNSSTSSELMDSDGLESERTFKRLKGGDVPDTKGILKTPSTSYKTPKSSSERMKIQDVIAFSQRQIHDIESVAVRLLKGLKSLKNIVEQTHFPESFMQSRYKSDEIKTAVDEATVLEGFTKKWLTIMARDCNRFCKIMKVSETNPVSPARGFCKERKISFADEAGHALCHFKVFKEEI